GVELQVIGVAEDCADRTTINTVHEPCTLAEPCTQQGVLQIGLSFFATGNRKQARLRASAEPSYLRKDEPHPVRLLAPRAQFGADLLDDRSLRRYEALQVVRIIHLGLDNPVERLQRRLSRPAARLDLPSFLPEGAPSYTEFTRPDVRVMRPRTERKATAD